MLAIGRNLSCSFAIPLSSLSDMAIAESYLMKSPVDLSDNILIYINEDEQVQFNVEQQPPSEKSKSHTTRASICVTSNESKGGGGVHAVSMGRQEPGFL